MALATGDDAEIRVSRELGRYGYGVDWLMFYIMGRSLAQFIRGKDSKKVIRYPPIFSLFVLKVSLPRYPPIFSLFVLKVSLPPYQTYGIEALSMVVRLPAVTVLMRRDNSRAAQTRLNQNLAQVSSTQTVNKLSRATRNSTSKAREKFEFFLYIKF